MIEQAEYNEFNDAVITIRKQPNNQFALELKMNAISGNEAAIKKTFESKYPKYSVKAANESVTVEGDLSPTTGEELSLVRRHVVAALFYDALDKQKNVVDKREEWLKMDMGRREHFYLRITADRLVLFQQMSFANDEDFMLARNWAQELCDMRAQPANSSAPPVSYLAKDVPVDLKPQLVKPMDERTLFFTWILFPVHVRPEKLETVVDSLGQFTISIRESLVRMRACINAKLQKHFDEQKKPLDSILNDSDAINDAQSNKN